jgi:uncharacterized protein DUF4349/putative zinc finger protein
MSVIQHPFEQEELMAYFDNELGPDRTAAAAVHLEQCEECRRFVESLRSVSRGMLVWQVEVSDSRMPELISGALQARGQKSKRKTSRWAWGLVAASLVVVTLSMVSPRMSSSRMAVDQVRTRHLSALESRAMIARTSQLVLLTTDFDKARGSLEDILKRHRGYVGQIEVSAPSMGRRVLTGSLRVPDDQLEPAFAEIKKLGRVESESQTGEDVSRQTVDLDARLSSARKMEQTLTELLRQRNAKMSEILAVELEMNRVRGAIERMEGEKRGLVNRLEYATLNVTVREILKEGLGISPNLAPGEFRNAAVEGFRLMITGLAGVSVFCLAYGPSLLLWGGLLFLLFRLVRLKLSRRSAE